MEVIYADRDLIVINKPPGIPVHGGDRVQGETVADFLLEKFPEISDVGDLSTSSEQVNLRPGIIHRLDKNTSGVMVVARNQQSFEALKELFQKRLVEKTYLAIVCGKLREKRGTINMPIGRVVKNPLKRGVATHRSKIRGEREAVTEYCVLRENDKYSLVELKPKTGRMHQLRVHLKAIGHPVACDKIYGGKKVCCPRTTGISGESSSPVGGRASLEGVARQLLHAQALAFSFPEGKRWRFEADLPNDFSVALKQIF